MTNYIYERIIYLVDIFLIISREYNVNFDTLKESKMYNTNRNNKFLLF